ncbi:MAG: hypothetical protein QY314_04670 [Candidatus Dojkabacteria bacterium]|nr:MAG: hypothetical protein QY314_04670 [Candidatus Dojkabacteria bacterium]
MAKAFIVIETYLWQKSSAGIAQQVLSIKEHYTDDGQVIQMEGDASIDRELRVEFGNNEITVFNNTGVQISEVDYPGTIDTQGGFRQQTLDVGETLYLQTPTEDKGYVWKVYFRNFV